MLAEIIKTIAGVILILSITILVVGGIVIAWFLFDVVTACVVTVIGLFGGGTVLAKVINLLF